MARALVARLYIDFYAQGAASPAVDRRLRPAGAGRADLVQGLAEVNAGRGCHEPGWQIVAVGRDGLSVRRGRLTLRVPESAFVPEEIGPPRPGTSGSLRTPNDRRGLSHGHYTAVGDLGLSPRSARSRIYWNITPQGAAPLVAALTRRLNGARLPFSLKVLSDSSSYDRCDAAVLLVNRADADAAIEMARTSAGTLTRWLREPVPAFTLPLGPGLAYADDPPDGESFGISRCRAIVRGVMAGPATSPRTTLARIEAALLSEGISLDAPHRTTTASPTRAERERPSAPLRRRAPAADPLEAALAIGHRVAHAAIRHGGRCVWITADVEAGPRGPRPRLRATDASLYDGTAGIALFLAELYAATGDLAMRRAARGALRHALTRPDDAGHGFHAGRAGIGFSAVRAGALIDDEGVAETGRVLLTRAPVGEAPPDLLDGLAGSLLGLVLDPAPDGRSREIGAALADAVLRRSRARNEHLSWPADAARGDVDDLLGMAHGASGIGLCLAEAGFAWDLPELVDAAQAAFAYERSMRDPDEGAWPDLRAHGRMGGPGPAATVAWCHGTAGVALARTRAWQLLGDPDLRGEAWAGLEITATHLRRSLAGGGADFGLCHGAAGLATILRDGARGLIGAPVEWTRISTEIAMEGIERYPARGLPWPCGPVGELPGLMTGVAGIGHFLIRVADPSAPSVLWPTPVAARCGRQGPSPPFPLARPSA